MEPRLVPRPPASKSNFIGNKLKVAAWRALGASQDLLDDLSYGIWVPTVCDIPVKRMNNYSSLQTALGPATLELDLLEQESKISEIPPHEVPSTIFSPLGAVPKKGTDRVRITYDASLFCNPYFVTRKISCPLLDDILPWITPNSWLWKRDQKGDYQQYWVEQSCRHYYGFVHPDGRLMRYNVLTFGANHSVADFCQFAYFTRDILRDEGIINWTYIDDSFGVNPSLEGALSDYNRAGELNDFLFVEEAPNKLCPPAQEMEILGYLVNTISMLISVPDKKRLELVALCNLFASLPTASLKEIQSFVGKLVWAARVVKGGKVFLSRLFPLLFHSGSKSTPIRLTQEFQADVTWWCKFLSRWNGIALIPKSSVVEVFTDASKYGYGAVSGELWISELWRPSQVVKHSNWKELCTILIAIRRWGSRWRGCQVRLHSDNMASVAICNRGYSRSPHLSKLMRSIFWATAGFDIDLSVVHIPGVLNTSADFLSRNCIRGPTSGSPLRERVLPSSS